MFKNQLQELAQRSCFNLPSYACIRQGPDHAPRFKASVNFNGEIFESPSYCTTLRQAEHAAAEVALNVLSSRGPSRSLTARVLDETGIYKNLLQETAHRAGFNLPVYTTVRSGPGHVPTFTCTVKLAGMDFTGEPAKTKKQAEKNAAIAAWCALKRMPNLRTFKNNDTVERHEDYKQAKKRDYSQARRRMAKGYRDNNALNYQPWKLLDLLLDSAIDSDSARKQSSFVSLLPPPPPRTTSKILPPNSSADSPHRPMYTHHQHMQNKGKKQVKETQVPVEEHQNDEEEWRCAIKKSKEGSGSSSSSLHRQFQNQEATATHISNQVFRPSSQSRVHMGNFSPFSNGMLYPQRLAPAVQIRSVIPVCAAPPATARPTPSVTGTNSSTGSNSTKTGTAETEVPVTSSKVNNNKSETSNPDQLEFNKKLQLQKPEQHITEKGKKTNLCNNGTSRSGINGTKGKFVVER